MQDLLTKLHNRSLLAADPRDGPEALSTVGRRTARNIENRWRDGLGPVITGDAPATDAEVEHYADLIPRMSQGRQTDILIGMFVAGRTMMRDDTIRRAIRQTFKVAAFRELLAELESCEGRSERLDIFDRLADQARNHKPSREYSFTRKVDSAFRHTVVNAEDQGEIDRDLKYRMYVNLFLLLFGQPTSTSDDYNDDDGNFIYAETAEQLFGQSFGLKLSLYDLERMDDELRMKLNGIVPRVCDVLDNTPLSELQESAIVLQSLAQSLRFMLSLGRMNISDTMMDRLTVLGVALMRAWDISADNVRDDITRMIPARQS